MLMCTGDGLPMYRPTRVCARQPVLCVRGKLHLLLIAFTATVRSRVFRVVTFQVPTSLAFLSLIWQARPRVQPLHLSPLPSASPPLIPSPAHTCPHLPTPSPAFPRLPVPSHIFPHHPTPSHVLPRPPTPSHTFSHLLLPHRRCPLPLPRRPRPHVSPASGTSLTAFITA